MTRSILYAVKLTVTVMHTRMIYQIVTSQQNQTLQEQREVHTFDHNMFKLVANNVLSLVFEANEILTLKKLLQLHYRIFLLVWIKTHTNPFSKCPPPIWTQRKTQQ